MTSDQGIKMPKSKPMTLERVEIEMADGGYIVKCHYEGGNKSEMYHEPEKKVVASMDDLMKLLKKKLA